ncbi:hypothetical protein B0H21DRAFT_445984 [Amylocystis lapponica]|nr:hypothetical protein B0H21DRAFT_445984 [Amylocystis lapponica]
MIDCRVLMAAGASRALGGARRDVVFPKRKLLWLDMPGSERRPARLPHKRRGGYCHGFITQSFLCYILLLQLRPCIISRTSVIMVSAFTRGFAMLALVLVAISASPALAAVEGRDSDDCRPSGCEATTAIAQQTGDVLA